MIIKKFNNLEEIEKYYDKSINTYVFKEDGKPINLVVFNFSLNIKSNIEACNIKAYDINAYNIEAWDITAYNIKAWNVKSGNITVNNIEAYDIWACDISAGDIIAENISYGAVCFAYNNIYCKSIKSRRDKNKHFVLDGYLYIDEENQ